MKTYGVRFFGSLFCFFKALISLQIKQQFNLRGIREVILSNSPSSAGKIGLNLIKVFGDSWKGMYFEDVPVLLIAKTLKSHKFNHWEVNGVTVLDKTIELNLKKATTVKAIYEDEIDDGKSSNK